MHVILEVYMEKGKHMVSSDKEACEVCVEIECYLPSTTLQLYGEREVRVMDHHMRIKKNVYFCYSKLVVLWVRFGGHVRLVAHKYAYGNTCSANGGLVTPGDDGPKKDGYYKFWF